MNIKGYILLPIFLFLAFQAHSTEDEKILKNQFTEDFSRLAGPDDFARTQAVLHYYGADIVLDQGPDLSEIQGQQSLAGAQSLLKYFDPHQIFSRLSIFSKSSLSVFQDVDQKKNVDFSVTLHSLSPLPDSKPKTKDPRYPLLGYRIALDPGHMGGRFWDELTGKFVEDSQGHIVSEGVINLQVSLLLKEELQKLGGEVLLTHESLGPATSVDYQTYDIKPYAQNELRDNIHAPWFMKLISQHPVGTALYHDFEQSPELKNLF
jgi:hypothetical protein